MKYLRTTDFYSATMKTKQFLLTAIAATSSFCALAQSNFPDRNKAQQLPTIETYLLEGTTIQEKRLNGNFGRDVQIISKQDIQSLPVRSVNELLSYVSGLDIRER